MSSLQPTVRLNADDNVVVARTAIQAHTTIEAEKINTREKIPAGHKIATSMIDKGAPIRRYGQIIGFASADIAAGDHVHVQNVEMQDFERDYAVGANTRPTAMLPDKDRNTFEGFVRPSGKVGTRNYIAILSSVNCSASVCKFIQQTFPEEALADYPSVDGVVALTHSTGCGMADRGEGFSALQRTLWGYARHPNFAGILMIGLGCEVNQIDFLLEAYGIKRGELFQHMTMQETGGTRKTVERAVGMIKEMLPHAAQARRQTVSASEITVALQCGGSDAYSGITANPALGYATDLLAAQGGTGILAETPEIYGAEHLLTQRAAKPEVADKLIKRIKWWEEYCASNGGEMNNNPSPGNKAGGLTTILEKSLGAAAKGGTTNLNQVLNYAEPATEARIFIHGQPRLRSSIGDGTSGIRIEYRRLYHWPRFLLWL